MTIFEVPNNLSHSQTSNLVGEYCSASYFYERVLGKPARPGWAMLGGSALHEASEAWDWAYLEGNVDQDPGYLARLFGEAMDKQIAERLENSPYPKEEWNVSGKTIKTKTTMDGGPNRKDEAWWREMGPLMLHAWTAWRLNTPWEIAVFPDPENDDTPVIGIETEYWADLGPAPSHGFIDRVFEQVIDGVTEYLVVDLKSGREPDDTAQLGSYRVGLQRRFGINPRWGTFWLGGSGGTTPLVDLRAMWPDERVDQRYRKARNTQLAGEFMHKPSNLCGSCGVRDWCPIVGGAKAGEVVQPWSQEVTIQVRPPKDVA